MNRKIVVRNILLSLLALVMLGALVYLALSTPKVKAGDRCRRVAIEVKSETGGDPLFLTPDRIADELARRGIQLQGKRLDSIDLRHIERTRVILHVIDMSASEGRDPYEDYVQINKELETYNLRLMERPQIIVANKMDMPESQENLKEFKKKLAANYDEFDELPQIFPISSLAHQGLDNLLEATAELLDKTPEFLLYSEDEMAQEEVYYGFDEDQPAFDISRDDDAAWVLSGEKLEKLFNMTNFDRDEAVMKFARQLRGMGVDEALRARGAKDGDIVRIGKFEFEFVD